MLFKLECIIQPSKLDSVKEALIEAGVEGITVFHLEGFGRQRGYKNGEVPNKEVKFLPKIKLEIVVEEEMVEAVSKTIVSFAKTKKIGAGKIFILPVEDAIRIRTSEEGKSAVS